MTVLTTPPVCAPSNDHPDMLPRLLQSGVESWRAAGLAAMDWWAGAARRGALTPMHAWQDTARWWQLTADRARPRWHTPNEVVLESPVARLRDFSAGTRRRVTP